MKYTIKNGAVRLSLIAVLFKVLVETNLHRHNYEDNDYPIAKITNQDKLNSNLNFNEVFTYLIISYYLGLKILEDSHLKCLQIMQNKIQHIANGNITPKKDIKFIKVMHLNKRNSFFNTNIEILKHSVARENQTVGFFKESNSEEADNLEESFPDYNIIHKKEDNHPLDRIVALIKKNKINYSHLRPKYPKLMVQSQIRPK